MPVSLSKSTELELIRRAAGGDRLASGELIRAHQTGLYGYIFRMSGRAEVAEDVVQEAFVRVLTNLDRFDPRFRFSTWLFTIGRRVFLNMLEKRRPSSDTDQVTERSEARDTREVAEDRLDDSFLKDSVQRALMMLGAEQREVVVLFHQHDWPIWLIARHLSMPEGTVKSHLHRGRSRVRELLCGDAGLPGSPANMAAREGAEWLAPADAHHPRPDDKHNSGGAEVVVRVRNGKQPRPDAAKSALENTRE